MILKVLSALDAAQTQWYHFRAIVIAGTGFFTDAYDLFVIPLVSNLLARLYYQTDTLPPAANSLVNGIALCGAFFGQLFFGWLGDRMGRKKMYGITLLLMVGSSIASGFSIGSSREAIIASLCFFRFWLGFGIGGDYPLSATIMAEYANTATRGGFIAAVFAMQGVGILAGSIVAMIVSVCFKDSSNPSFAQMEIVWRIILMMGAAPALFTYYWRMQMPETARYTALVEKKAKQAAADMSRVLRLDIEEDEENIVQIETEEAAFGLFSRSFARLHGKYLLGTASTWFFADIAFYSSSLFQKDIYKAVGWLHEPYKNPLHEVYSIARAQALIALCGTLPGYIFTIFFVDRIGRFPIQLGGFFFMSVFLFALAGPSEKHWNNPSHRHGFLAMYSFTFFFSNFGPNSTTFIVPAELFPARLRSTCYGISAAAGKAGAIIGAFGFVYAAQPKQKDAEHRDRRYPTGIGVDKALMILAVASCLGFLFTFLIPETKGRSLEENEVEFTEESSSEENEVELARREGAIFPTEEQKAQA